MSDVVVRVESVGGPSIGVDDKGVIKGDDGFSPVVSFEQIEDGYKLTIVDANGAHEANILNGAPGQDGGPGPQGIPGADGQDGSDGFSPTVSVSGITGGHRITITDATGAHSADVMDGENGADGQDGTSPAVTFGVISGGHTMTVTDKTHPIGQTINIMDGAPGPKGDTGDTGSTGPTGPAGPDGVSPAITVTDIPGGHRVTITDAEHPTGQSFDVMDGEDGQVGPAGKSAYESAQDGGYSGTEQQFNNDLAGVGDKYEKPSPGIPKTDLAEDVQTSLGKADAALPASGGTMSGAIAMGGNRITGIANGTNDQDAVTKAQLDAAVVGALKPSGSIAFASLPTLSASVLNNIYNITDAFTTTSDFVEGSGMSYPAGTNVAVINTGTAADPVYKFDVYTGVIDLSAYRTAAAQDVIDAGKLGTGGDGSNVTAAFSAASSRANIATGEKLSVIFGKIAKWFSDLGTAAFRAATNAITQGSTDLIESGAVYTGLAAKQGTINASGILKGDGSGGVSAATPGTDYLAPSALTPYRTAAVQDVIDAGKETAGLGLTGAAVGDLVRVAAVDANGKPTSWRKASLREIVTNRNMMDDWYFVGGGSQQGGEQFPINQRGQTVYSSSGYTIDRWELFVGGQIIIDSDGLRFSSGELQWSQLRQPIETSSIHGQTVTFSVLFSTVSNPIYLYAMNDNNVDIMVSPEITSAGLHSITFVVPSTGSKLYLAFQQRTNSGQNVERCKIKACKLELGSEQTLAHQENGVWVLNEIPDYGEELAKCQRYFYRYKPGRISSFANGFYQAETSFAFTGNLGAPLKGIANGILNGVLYAGSIGHTGPNAMIVTNVGELIMFPNGLIGGTAVTAATTSGNAVILQVRDSATYIDFSCEP